MRMRKVPLPEPHRTAFERLVRGRGDQGAAAELGVGIGVIHQLAGGGLAIPATVEKVVHALEDLPRSA